MDVELRESTQARKREQKLRDNGIPVQHWGDDMTLMWLYAAEMRAIRHRNAQIAALS